MSDDLDVRLAAAVAADAPGELLDLGCDLADAGRQAEAESCFRRAVALGADWAWINVGDTLRELGRPLEAVAAYERALAAGETDAWFDLGQVLEELGDVDGAVRAYRAAGEVAGQPEGFLELAHLLHGQDRDAAAEAAAARAAAMGLAAAAGLPASWRWDRHRDPALEPELRAGAGACGAARVALAELLTATGRREQARAELEHGAKLGQRECWLPLGNLLAAGTAGDLASARDAYRAGISAGDSYCHHNLGLLLLQEGDLDGAQVHFAAGAASGDPVAVRALERLREQRGA